MTYPTSIGTFSHDRLRAGCCEEEVSRKATILANEASLVRGSVLGRVAGAITETHAGNTGNGVMGAITAGRLIEDGAQYKLTITAAAANAGTFELRSPRGALIKTGTVGVAFVSDHMSFTLADGATDFIVGDTFLINVAFGTKFRLVNSANTDGSGRAAGVLLKDTVTSTSDITDAVYALEGEFNEAALVFGGTDTIETHRARLLELKCFLRKSQDVNGVG